ncbi:MAG: FlgO family outer membrane protein [Planctomycetota bacterium]
MSHTLESRPVTRLVGGLGVALTLAACAAVGGEYDPTVRGGAGASANTPSQIAELAAALEERASARVQVGALRVLVEPFEEVEGELPRHRHAILDAREAQAVVETLQYELTLSLGNRVNVVDPAAVTTASGSRAELRRATGATHAVVGTWYRAGDDVDVAARLVALDDGWIVATAQRRIVDFEGRILSSTRSAADTRRRLAERAPAPASKGGLVVVGELPVAPTAEESIESVLPRGVELNGVEQGVLEPGGAPPRSTPPSGTAAAEPTVGADGVPVDFDPAAVLGPGAEGPAAARLRGRTPLPAPNPAGDGPAGDGL